MDKKTHNLTVEHLKTILRYDSETGNFFWIKEVRSGAYNNGLVHLANALAGTKMRGYTIIRIDNVGYRAHRLAWFYVHEEWPKHEIDHLNGDRSDNRILNLRDVTRRVNSENMRAAQSRSKLGVLGVHFDEATKKYKSAIGTMGKVLHLGYFNTIDDASEAYLQAKRAHHTGNTL